MAHLRSITWQCEKLTCSARASEQVYTFRNEPLGRYCRTHAKEALKRQLEAEKED